jgi:hypothetical protein
MLSMISLEYRGREASEATEQKTKFWDKLTPILEHRQKVDVKSGLESLRTCSVICPRSCSVKAKESLCDSSPDHEQKHSSRPLFTSTFCLCSRMGVSSFTEQLLGHITEHVLKDFKVHFGDYAKQSEQGKIRDRVHNETSRRRKQWRKCHGLA